MNLHQTIKSIKFTLAKPEDAQYNAFDNVRLVAMETCPRWATIRYQMHLTDQSNSRVLPLEAGAACHDVFAAIRLWQLWVHQGHFELMKHHGVRIFGEERFGYLLEQVTSRYKEPLETLCTTYKDHQALGVHFILGALETSGYYDDPDDKKRTLANMEDTCVQYFSQYNFDNHVWIRDVNDPKSDVGIEIRFEILVEFVLDDDEVKRYRFVGIMDGIHVHNTQRNGVYIAPHENKTTSSYINDTLRDQYHMSTQVTGYIVAATVFTNEQVNFCWVHHTQLPLPARDASKGVTFDKYSRNDDQINDWCRWFLYHAMLYDEIGEDYNAAPINTHSCTRYFRSCSLIPVCTAVKEDRADMISQMVVKIWDPLTKDADGND